ncbi:MAG: hypothetical protein H7334_05095 [Ferruginibacter sp.]|nr:hypothetical protein [Ferruginibacter sp.]
MEVIGVASPTGKALTSITFARDFDGNIASYSLIVAGDKKNRVWRGAGYGLAVGLGILLLAKPLSLNDEPITKRKIRKY